MTEMMSAVRGGEFVMIPKRPSSCDPHADEIIRLRKLNYPNRVIAERLGITHRAVDTWCRRRQIPGRPRGCPRRTARELARARRRENGRFAKAEPTETEQRKQ